MNHHTIGRIVSALIFGLLVGLVMHHDHVSRGDLGRETFLTQQGARFDLYFAHPSLAFDGFSGLFLIGGFFGAYEAAAYGIARILTILAANKDRPPPVS